MTNSIIKTLTATIVFFTFSLPATAQESCPAPAVPSLYIMKYNVERGIETDISKVFNIANESLKRCADNALAQALSAELFVIIGASLPPADLDNKFLIYSNAYDAIMNHVRTFKYGETPTDIDLGEGRSQKYRSNDKANSALTATMGRLAQLSLDGKTHQSLLPDYFSSNPVCPYKDSDRVEAEISGYLTWLVHEGSKLKATKQTYHDYRRTAVTRLEGIWNACSRFQSNYQLSFYIADYYHTMAEHVETSDPNLALTYARKANEYAELNDLSADNHDLRPGWKNGTRYKFLIKRLNKLEAQLGE